MKFWSLGQQRKRGALSLVEKDHPQRGATYNVNLVPDDGGWGGADDNGAVLLRCLECEMRGNTL
jgi:hypothetical protein